MDEFLEDDPIIIFAKPVRGKATKPIFPHEPGRCEAFGSNWIAVLYPPNSKATILPNSPINVIGRQGIRLLINPLELS